MVTLLLLILLIAIVLDALWLEQKIKFKTKHFHSRLCDISFIQEPSFIGFSVQIVKQIGWRKSSFYIQFIYWSIQFHFNPEAV